jgi:type IV pilus assembly protein PilQ
MSPIVLGKRALLGVALGAIGLCAIGPEAHGRPQAAEGVPAEAKGTAAKSVVRDLRFLDRRESAQVVVTCDGQVVHRLARIDGQPVLELLGARLPRLLERTLDTSAFHGPVKGVTSYADGDRVIVRVSLADRSLSSRLRRDGDRLIWEFPKLEAAPRGQAAGAPRQATAYDYATPRVAAAKAKGSAERQYSGRRIDLDFKDADIHNILRLLSDVGNVNIITSDNVAGRITIRMRNVPWDQALDVILRAKGLGQVREGNLVRVAPLTDLEKEREAEIARQKQVQLLRPLETRLLPLSYAKAEKILDKLQYTLSSRGKLTYDDRTNMVIARDTAPNLDLMEKLIRNLDTQTPQVLIEARIVEARTNFTKEIGIQWGGNFTASATNGNATGLVFPSQVGLAGGVKDSASPTGGLLLGQSSNPNFAVDLPATVSSGSGGAVGLTLGSVGGAVNLNLRLSAAETSGDIRIISSPKIMTLDNVEAKITQGTTIPYSQVSASGVQTTFKDADLKLTVKPHVTADGSIIMSIEITRNEPDFVNTGTRGEPTILKKEAKTEMLIKDGDTTVIGGIYSTRIGVSWRKVPYLGDIPILGWLFKYKKDAIDRSEVLVFVTPRIVNRGQSIGQ